MTDPIFDVRVFPKPVSFDAFPPRYIGEIIAQGTDPLRMIPKIFGLETRAVPTHGHIREDYYYLAQDWTGEVRYHHGVPYERSECEIYGHRVPDADVEADFSIDCYPSVKFSGGTCRVCGEQIARYP